MEPWQEDPVLLSLAVLIQSLEKGNTEQARQEAQTISRCLAMGASPPSTWVESMLADLAK